MIFFQVEPKLKEWINNNTASQNGMDFPFINVSRYSVYFIE